MDIVWKGAHQNNFEKGRKGKKPQHIIVHWIVGTLKSADATFQNPNRIASAHFGVGPNAIHQYVADGDTAYHAGDYNTNLESFGIEHEGGPELPIAEAVYENSAKLIAHLSETYDIPLDRTHIKGHKEVSKRGTQCPGTLDIDKLISMAKGKLEGGDMDAELRRILTQKATQWDNIAGKLSLDPLDGAGGQKAIEKIETIERERNDARNSLSQTESELKAVVADNTQLDVALKACEAKPPRIEYVVKEKLVETVVQPRTWKELGDAILHFIRGGEKND